MHAGRKLGAQPRAFDQRIPHLSSLRLMHLVKGVVLPPIPASLNYFQGMPADLGMMLNGPDPSDPNALVLGDCTIAGAHHAPQIWDHNSGVPMVASTNDNIVDDYSDACGYVRGRPDTDQGGIEQSVLKYWMTDGMRRADGTRDKLLGFVEIDPRNISDIKQAIAECGVVYFGANVPEEWTEVQGPGGTWGMAGPGIGGHCFLGGGYTPDNILVTSWGINALNLTNLACQNYVTECYALFSANWIAKTGKVPFGLDMSTVRSSIQAIAA
jgi:hypothetical protein